MLKLFLNNQLKFFSSGHGPKCLILHPVGYPNKGPLIEQYLAEEAVGLVSSLKWEVVRGPFWNKGGDIEKHANRFHNVPGNSVYMEA